MSIRGDWLLFKMKRSRLKQQVATSFCIPAVERIIWTRVIFGSRIK
ncbi:hypothetical protein [Secundilactobacillus silagei]|nr:hypothetical protein [Secundilactobacillus silagei]